MLPRDPTRSYRSASDRRHRHLRSRRLIDIEATLHDEAGRRAIGLQRRGVSRRRIIGGGGCQVGLRRDLGAINRRRVRRGEGRRPVWPLWIEPRIDRGGAVIVCTVGRRRYIDRGAGRDIELD